MVYARTAGQKAHDFAAARDWEEEVEASLRKHRMLISHFSSNNKLDVWVPGWYAELKEKRQSYTDRWTKHTPHIPEEWLFISDELTVRRALKHYPYVVFLIRDITRGRLFCSPIWEMVSIPRVRVNRNGKGKWLLDMRHFQQISQVDDVIKVIESGLTGTTWLASSCVGPGVGEV